MSTPTKKTSTEKATAARFAKAGSVRCNISHSGNTHLTFDAGYFQCDGCGHFHTIDSVLAAGNGPAQDWTGAGGVVHTR